MIRIAIEMMDEESSGLASRFLERLSVIMTPVYQEALEMCFEEAVADLGDKPIDQQVLVKKLVEARLLRRVVSGRGTEGYVADPMVHGYMYQRERNAGTDVLLPSFSLPGYTAGRVVVDPGSHARVKMVSSLFDRLAKAAEKAVKTDKMR